MDTTVNLWILASLAVVGIILGILFLILLPRWIRNLDEKTLVESLTYINSTGSGGTIYHMDIKHNHMKNNPPKQVTLQQKIGEVLNFEPPGHTSNINLLHNSTVSHEIQKIIDKFEVLTTVACFHLAFLVLVTISLISYPSALWFIWGFFPSNSTVVLSILLFFVSCSFDILQISNLRYQKKMALILSKNNNLSKTEMEAVKYIFYNAKNALLIPICIRFVGYIFIGMRALFLFIGTHAYWVDGIVLLPIIILADCLWPVVHLINSV